MCHSEQVKNPYTYVFRFFALLRMTLLMLFDKKSINDFETAIRNQCLRNTDTFRCLMVFEQGS